MTNGDSTSEMDDAVLLTRARKGDERAFSALFERHERRIFRYAAYMCGPQAGDDVVQVTFLAVLRQSSRHDAPRTTVAAYLLGIARHVVMKRSVPSPEISFADPPEPDGEDAATEDITPLEALSKAETVATVREAVEALPAPYREVMVLCELQELDYEGAAAAIECPVGTVRSRLHRARRLLATKLKALMPVGAEGSSR